MAKISVKDANGAIVEIEKPLAPGRAAAAAARPVVLSTEDLAALTAISTALSGIASYVDGLEALITTLNGYTDGIEGLIAAGNGTATSIAGYVDGLETLVTATNSALSTLNSAITTLQGYVDGLEALTGAVNETAPASDTASSGLNGRLQRVAQRITSLIALLPAALGPAAYNASLAVVGPRSATGTPTQVGASTSAVTVLAANAARLGGVVVNDSTSRLYLILSNTAPTSAIYTYKMEAGDMIEIPANYTGIIKGIWVSATGNAVVTELT